MLGVIAGLAGVAALAAEVLFGGSEASAEETMAAGRFADDEIEVVSA